MKTITVTEFAALRDSGAAYTLLDVRRDDELAIAKYPEPFLHIEMSEIADRLDEIPRDKPLIVGCKSGGRSAKVAALLMESGFPDVSNLTGGITAWATEIDPSISIDHNKACPTS